MSETGERAHFKMGLISDRKNKANRRGDRNDALNGSSKSLAVYPQQPPLPPPPHHLHHHHLPPMHHGLGPPGHALAHPPPHKRGIFGPQVLPTDANGLPIKNNAPKYPAGYYTTPVHSSSGAGWVQQYNVHQYGGGGGGGGGGSHHHPAQPKYQPNVNPRYQTWVAPRKQPSLGQLVRITRVGEGGTRAAMFTSFSSSMKRMAISLVQWPDPL